jgi:dihydrolipoamide dehydrogenase
MVMGESADAIDLLVIGGGPAGYPTALRAAQLGRNVTLVDRDGLGGVCLNVGCIPSKTLIEAAHAHELMRDIIGDADAPALDLAAWQQRKSEVVGGLVSGVTGQLKTAGVNIISGSARFTSRSRVAVESPGGSTVFLEFRHAVIATGSRPTQIPALPAEDERVIDSTGVLALQTIPKQLVVVGAGYIGIELATAMAKLGSAVTIVEMQGRVLPEMPEIFARPVARRLAQLGVTVHTGSTVVGMTADGVTCQVAGADEPTILPADKVLVAVGRRPNTDDIGLESARITVGDDGRIPVGDNRIIGSTDIAAVGDITAGPMLAHKGTAEGVVAAEALCGLRSAFDPAAIPLVVFSDPEVASAGLTEDDARAAGMTVRAVTVPIGAIGRAATMGARIGFTQLVVDTERDAVVGVHIVGPHASDLISEGVLAIEMSATPTDIAATIHPHPTLSEGIHESASRYVHETAS